MEKQNINFKEIRYLSERFTPEQIESCIASQIERGDNKCEISGPTEEVINELVKAEFVRKKIAEGASQKDAIRELATRIRSLQQGFSEP